MLRDSTSDGRFLMTFDEFWGVTAGLFQGNQQERDFSWLDDTKVSDISNDGHLVLLQKNRRFACGLVGSWKPPQFLKRRKICLIVPTRSFPIAFSAHRYRRNKILQHRKFYENTYPAAMLFPYVRKILFVGHEKGQTTRLYLQKISGGKPVPAAQGAVELFPNTISPDGQSFVGKDGNQSIRIYSIQGDNSQPAKGIKQGEIPFQWNLDGTGFYAYGSDVPVEIFLVNVSTGARTSVKTLSPLDPTGIIGIASVSATPDGKNFVYSYQRALSTLYLVGGLR
jgi:hypothetical protein